MTVKDIINEMDNEQGLTYEGIIVKNLMTDELLYEGNVHGCSEKISEMMSLYTEPLKKDGIEYLFITVTE